MNTVRLTVVALAFCIGSLAQSSANAQASSSANAGASVTAGQAQVQSNDSADANAAASMKSASASSQAGNQTSAAAKGGAADVRQGSTIEAVLTKPVDVKKNKAGDEVTAKVTQDVRSTANAGHDAAIPKGSRLIGHVTEAKPRDKAKKASSGANASGVAASDSVLGIEFDKAILKDGREIPIHAVVQAVGSAQQALAANAGDSGLTESSDTMAGGGGVVGGRPSGGGLVGGATGAATSSVSAVGNTAGGLGQTATGAVDTTTNAAGSVHNQVGRATTASGQLTSSARGVVGLQGLNLTSEASDATQGSLITSSTRDVKLDSGSQMVLKVTGAAR